MRSAAPQLRVLEVSKSTGGLGTYMRWLADGFDRSRFALTFACLSSGAAALADELSQRAGVTAYGWPMDRYKINPFTDAQVIVRLARLIRRERFDLVHAHGSKAGFIARVAAIGSRVPVVYSPHNFSFHAGVPRWQANIFAFVERLTARFLTAKIITVSDGEQEMARQFGVGKPDLFVTVHSGVDLSAFSRRVEPSQQKTALGVPAEALLVGTVGRLSEQKNPLDFVRMAARVHEKMPAVHFIWIGDGPLETSARKLTFELGLGNTMHLVGPRTDVPADLQALDVFVMTSRWEAFSLALLEAMTCGLPVVASRLPGIAEAVTEGASGYLLPIGDVDGMSAAVQAILGDRGLAQRLGANARQCVEQKFTRSQMMDKLMKVYQSVQEYVIN
jgi:glycosyltransferase involved in cell wall biosynthesis